MELQIKSDDEISLPAAIAASPLTLAEIGAIACIACIEATQGADEEGLSKRLQSPEMMEALKSLKERGVFSIGMDGNTVSMKLNLEAVGL